LTKNFKLKIKNTQIAKALNLDEVKEKLAKKGLKKDGDEKSQVGKPKVGEVASTVDQEAAEKKPKREIRARTRSAFSGDSKDSSEDLAEDAALLHEQELEEELTHPSAEVETPAVVEEPSLIEEVYVEPVVQELPSIIETVPAIEAPVEVIPVVVEKAAPPVETPPVVEQKTETQKTEMQQTERKGPKKPSNPSFKSYEKPGSNIELIPQIQDKPVAVPGRKILIKPKFGPIGRHVNDLLPPKKAPEVEARKEVERGGFTTGKELPKKDLPPVDRSIKEAFDGSAEGKKGIKKAPPTKEFKDFKPARKGAQLGSFDSRDRHGLVDSDRDQAWRRKRGQKPRRIIDEIVPDRPKELKVRLPITVKDLAVQMKLKSSELIGKLFMQGIVMTLNDLLDDETTIVILGEEFDCKITIDTTEEKRIKITDQSVREEISGIVQENLMLRPPVVAFMGHVDHGKTSLIDAIRSSNVAAGEAGAITQHIGAFCTHTSVGDITILDTPGHEAFSAMRARGADVTDIVVLVVAGDEGIRQQTEEAIQHAKAAGVTIVVALNKCDKSTFNAENVYRQLAEKDLLPEAWGGHILTINCSATTKQGIQELLETLALQAEILELRANPKQRARGRVLESEMNTGRGNVATVLVQNGTLRKGDSVVFGTSWGKVKTMHNDMNRSIDSAGPSQPVEITGLSGSPEAGEEFVVVSSEKEAKDIAEVRATAERNLHQQRQRRVNLDKLLQQAAESEKKVLNLIIRADMQGSLEALKAALLKIHSDKAYLQIILEGVGNITESDIQLAAASNAMALGFHSQMDSFAEGLAKELGVEVRTHDIIYHAIDDVRAIMTGMLDKLAKEEDRGVAEVRAIFKSSHLGIIAGCLIAEGTIHRNHKIKVYRDGKVVWNGGISSLRREKDDVREVLKGYECGIVLDGFTDVKEGDRLQAYEITYISQQL
jgi:translation initiation factor IF-2